MQSSAKLAVLVGTHQTVNKSEEKQIDYYTRQVYKNFDLLALKELAEGDESNSLHHEKNDVEIIILRFPADLQQNIIKCLLIPNFMSGSLKQITKF